MLAEPGQTAAGIEVLGVFVVLPNAQNFYASRGLTRFSEHVFVLGDDRQTDFLLKKALV